MDPKYSRYFMFVRPVFKNPYVKTYSTLVFSIIAVTFFSLFAIRPTVKTIVALQKDIEVQQQLLDKATQKARDLEEGRKNYQDIDPETKDKLDKLLPSKLEVDRVIDNLITVSRNNQASVSGIQFQPIDIENTASASAKATLKEVAFTFNISAPYDRLVTLLNSLTTLDNLIYIESVNMNKAEEGPLIMSVNAKTYLIR